MKKLFILLLVISAFSISLYFSTAEVSLNEVQFGPSLILLWTLPLVMVVINTQLILLPRLLRSTQHFDRFRKGFEWIFLALTSILLSLHLGILLISSGNNFNLFVFVPLWVGIVLITVANTLPRFIISSDEDDRSSHSTWNRMIRPASYPLMIGGVLMLLCMLLPESLVLTGFFILLGLTLLAVGIRSYQALTV